MADVIWSAEASVHLREIMAYTEQFDAAAAGQLCAALLALGQSLTVAPNRGRPASDGARELVTVRPYILRYSVHGDRVLIRSIRHTRRRPLR